MFLKSVASSILAVSLLGASAAVANDMLQGTDENGVSCEQSIRSLLQKYDSIVESDFALQPGDNLVIESLADLDPGTLLIKKEILVRTENSLFGTTKYRFEARGSYTCDGPKIISAKAL